MRTNAAGSVFVQARRNLRGDLERRGLAINDDFIDAFSEVNEKLASIRTPPFGVQHFSLPGHTFIVEGLRAAMCVPPRTNQPNFASGDKSDIFFKCKCGVLGQDIKAMGESCSEMTNRLTLVQQTTHYNPALLFQNSPTILIRDVFCTQPADAGCKTRPEFNSFCLLFFFFSLTHCMYDWRCQARSQTTHLITKTTEMKAESEKLEPVNLKSHISTDITAVRAV